MKQINFLKAGMRNFCCYQEMVEYIFTNDKIILITGPNGVGKTTIFDSIPFTLYGATTKGTKSDDVVNNVIGKNCHTYVEFTIQNGDTIDFYHVDRYVKDSKLSDTVLLFKNKNAKPYKKGQKEVLPTIENLLVPQKLFSNTLLFGQKVKDFFTDLTDSDQKAIFRKVLLLDNYVLYYDETTKRIKKKTSDLQEVDKNLSLNSKLIISTDSYIRLTKENIENFEIKKKEEIQALTLEIDELNTDLLELQEIEKIYVNVNDLELNQIKKDISVIENEIQKLTTELNHQVKLLTNSKNSKEAEINAKAKELIAKENLERSELISKLNNEANFKITELQSELNGLLNSIENNKIKTENNNKQIKSDNEKIDKLFDSLNQEKPVCPTCGKPLTDETVNKHLKEELNDLYITRDAAVNSNIKLEEFNKKYSKVIKDLRESINKYTNDHELNLVAADGQCNEQIHIINERLTSSLETLESSFNKKMDSIELEFDEKSHEFQDKLLDLQSEQQKLEMLFDEKNRLSEKISEAKRNVASKQSDIRTKESQKYNEGMLEHYIEEMTRLEEEKRILASSKTELNDSIEMLEFWKDGFSSTGIPSLLIDEAIPFLNSAVAEYLEKIGGRYVASFDTLSTTKAGEYRDKINVNVLDTKTKANNRKQLSGGQTRVIDIAILLSLCDLQNNVQDMKTNILLLDEIFDSLDDQNISYVSSLLRTLAKGKAINLISHRHIDSIEADEVIRLF